MYKGAAWEKEKKYNVLGMEQEEEYRGAEREDNSNEKTLHTHTLIRPRKVPQC